ncbi:MAG: methyltransferase domain-containing protein [Aphanocapsa sp. GSE-SYN-MK-11-07L]|nr:methyltransferase domain-containing protein [Aphanocapsa sp. GSE-SYN-MK-11-07L]
MLAEHVEKILASLKPEDIVLDVGGWACPFNRANYVLDAEPYETRGHYATIGMPAFQGTETEYFSQETWIQRDICEKSPFPFPDHFFDFSICSHTLEDVRDPLFVCSELVRVSKRGYIEVPSRLMESTRGCEAPSIAGLSHHRWLVEIADHHIQFTMKYHIMHSDFQLSFPASFGQKIAPLDKVDFLFWENNFTFAETTIHGADRIYENLRQYVAQRYAYPGYLRTAQKLNQLLTRGIKGLERRLRA